MILRESYIVPELNKHYRLSDLPTGQFKTINSRAGFKKSIKKGYVFVNKSKGLTSTFIKGGESIEIYGPEIIINKKTPKVALTILYEDDHIAAIHKPAGVLVSGNQFKTIQKVLPQYLKKSNQKDYLEQPQPAHRLDFPTSGVLLIGKTSEALTRLNQLFESKKIQKTYFAVTSGKMNLKGNIDSYIEDKKAITYYQVIQSIISPKFEFLNLVKLSPITGRRHQLRIHLSEQGNAILGDPDYGNIETNTIKKGVFLHAKSIEFKHPITQKELIIEAPLPKKFLQLFPDL